MTCRTVFVVSLALLVCVPETSLAQSNERSEIAGHVTDVTGEVVANATVELTGSTLLGGARVTGTDVTGRYRFTGLLPGRYSVTASFPGLQRSARQDIVLPVNTTYEVGFVLAPARVVESIDVPAAGPLLDLRRSSSPSLFGGTALHDLPTDRTLGAVLALAPGVVTTPPLFGVSGEVAFGGTQGSNGFTVDGVDLTEPTLGNQWSGINYNWLDQVEVVALGAGAMYGGFTGAIANGVLRSGSNRLSGLGEWLHTGPGWSSDNLDGFPKTEPAPAASRTILSWWDLNAQVGFPVIKDRLWLFTGANSFHHDYRPVGVTAPGHASERTSRALAKMDASVTPSFALQGFWTRDASDVVGSSLSRFYADPVTSPDQLTRTRAWNARGAWTPRPSLRVEARYSGNRGDVDRVPHSPATYEGPSPGWVADANSACCNAQWAREYRRTSMGSATVGVSKGSPLGLHDLTVGIEVERAPSHSAYGVPTGRSVTFNQGRIVRYTEWAGDHLQTRNERTSFVLHDRWTLATRLTIEPGLRIDRQSGSLPSQDDVIVTTAVGPRIGLAWDVTGHQTTVLRAHYGRYFDRLFGLIYNGFEPGAASPHVVYVVTADGPKEDYRYSETLNAAVGAGLKQPRMDQFTLGIERRLGAQTTVQAQYVARQFGDFLGFVDRQLASWTSHEVVDPGPDGIAGSGDDIGLITVYRPYGSDFDSTGRDLLLSNPQDAQRNYRGVQAIITRRFANRFQFQSSYTWSRTAGNVGNEYNTNATAWSLSPLGSIGSNPNVARFAEGPSTYDYSEFKSLGSYRAPWLGGLTAAGVFRWHSGVRWNRSVVQTAPFFSVYPAEPAGSRKAPSLGGLDARVEKRFALGRIGTCGAYVDVFNVTNVGRPTGFVGESGRTFGFVSGWTEPRTARLGIRWEF